MIPLEYSVQSSYDSSLRLKSKTKVRIHALSPVTTDIHIGCMSSTCGNIRLQNQKKHLTAYHSPPITILDTSSQTGYIYDGVLLPNMTLWKEE